MKDDFARYVQRKIIFTIVCSLDHHFNANQFLKNFLEEHHKIVLFIHVTLFYWFTANEPPFHKLHMNMYIQYACSNNYACSSNG